MWRITWQAFVVLLLTADWLTIAAASGPTQKRAIRPEGIAAIRWGTAPALSPDGKQVVYVVVEWDVTPAKAARKSTLWLAATDGSQPPRAVAAEHQRASKPLWSPDGHHVAFLSPG